MAQSQKPSLTWLEDAVMHAIHYGPNKREVVREMYKSAGQDFSEFLAEYLTDSILATLNNPENLGVERSAMLKRKFKSA